MANYRVMKLISEFILGLSILLVLGWSGFLGINSLADKAGGFIEWKWLVVAGLGYVWYTIRTLLRG